MRRVVVVLVVLAAAGGLVAGGYLLGRAERTAAAPSPRPTISSTPDPCAIVPTLQQIRRRVNAAWSVAYRQAKGATIEKYRAAFSRAAGKLTAIKADLQALPVPAQEELRRARSLMQQSVARLLASVERASVVTAGGSIAAANTALAEANALQSDANRHLKAAGC